MKEKPKYEIIVKKSSKKNTNEKGIKEVFVDKNKFLNAYKLINSTTICPEKEKGDKQCRPLIYLANNNQIYNFQMTTKSRLLLEARKCVLNSDWLNLTKILLLLADINITSMYYPLIKYNLINVLSNPILKNTSFISRFLRAVALCRTTKEADKFLQELLVLPEVIVDPKANVVRLKHNEKRAKAHLYDKFEEKI